MIAVFMSQQTLSSHDNHASPACENDRGLFIGSGVDFCCRSYILPGNLFQGLRDRAHVCRLLLLQPRRHEILFHDGLQQSKDDILRARRRDRKVMEREVGDIAGRVDGRLERLDRHQRGTVLLNCLFYLESRDRVRLREVCPDQ